MGIRAASTTFTGAAHGRQRRGKPPWRGKRLGEGARGKLLILSSHARGSLGPLSELPCFVPCCQRGLCACIGLRSYSCYFPSWVNFPIRSPLSRKQTPRVGGIRPGAPSRPLEGTVLVLDVGRRPMLESKTVPPKKSLGYMKTLGSAVSPLGEHGTISRALRAGAVLRRALDFEAIWGSYFVLRHEKTRFFLPRSARVCPQRDRSL